MINSFIVLLINFFLFISIYKFLIKKDRIILFEGGRWFLTWLSISFIAAIIEFSSLFYAPIETYGFIKNNIFFFIIFGYLFFHYLTTRLVEISEIMNNNGIKEGGVFSFSYFILGPTFSTLVASTLLVTYLLTASISSVSIFENNIVVFSGISDYKTLICIAIIWLIALSNNLGFKSLPRINMVILLVFFLTIINILFFGFISLDRDQIARLYENLKFSTINFWNFDLLQSLSFLSFGLSIVSLSFNGLETILSNMGFVKDWKTIGKSYTFLMFLMLIIPITVILIFIRIDDISSSDLIPKYVALVMNSFAGDIVRIISGLILLIVINYSFGAVNDLLEKVFKKFKFIWFLKINKHSSYPRIHLLTAISTSVILIVLNGNQTHLADLLAFAIIMNLVMILGSLLIYRYFQGTEQISLFNTSRFGTLLYFVVLVGCVFYLIFDKIILSMIWIVITSVIFYIGSKISRRYPSEIETRKQFNNPMDLVFYIAELSTNSIDIHFVRPKDDLVNIENSVFVNYFNINDPLIEKIGSNHFRYPIIGSRLMSNILAILNLVKYELPDAKIKIHFGWPLSSWIDRLSIGVMIFAIMKLPTQFPDYEFLIEYQK